MSKTIYTPSISNIEEHEPERKATFTIEPLMSGYGMTLGNSLRRILLSSISGAAIVAFKAEGATHEFTSISGVKEDLVEVMLNLKGIRFKILKDGEAEEADASAPLHLELSKKGAGPVTAADIRPHPDIEVVNPSHQIATLDGAADKIDLELVVSFGRGYLPIEDSEAAYAKNDYISIDAIFSPVLRVRYKLANTRVGRMTDLDKLSLSIETDGALTPQEAFEEAAAILREHYATLSGASVVDTQSFHQMNEVTPEDGAAEVDKLLELFIEDLHLSARTTSTLR